VTTAVLAKLAERGDIDPSERVVLYITGEGLKTLDAVRSTFEAVEVDATAESFAQALGATVAA
jgi:threonine synthase